MPSTVLGERKSLADGGKTGTYLGPAVRGSRRTGLGACRARRGFTLIELLVVVAIIAVLIALFLPAVQSAREAARRQTCANNLKQFGLAIHSHENALGFYPDNQRIQNNRHGWLEFILPYLDQSALYDQINFDAGWHDPPNSTVAATRIGYFNCPSTPNASDITDGNPDTVTLLAGWTASRNLATTDYAAIQGVAYRAYTAGYVDTYGEGFAPSNVRSRPRDILDGLSRTLAVAESAGKPNLWRNGKKINKPTDHLVNGGGWVRPASNITFEGSSEDGSVLPGPCAINCTNGEDIGGLSGQVWSLVTTNTYSPLDTVKPPAGTYRGLAEYGTVGTGEPYSFHPTGAHFLFIDGSVQFLGQSIDTRVFGRLITRSGGEDDQAAF